MLIRESKQIIEEYMQVLQDIQTADVVVLKNIEQKLDEIFTYCNTHSLNIVVIKDVRFDYELRIIVKRSSTRYFTIEGGESNLYLPWGHIGEAGGEKAFYKDLDDFLYRLKTLKGVDNFIKEMTPGAVFGSIPDSEDELF